MGMREDEKRRLLESYSDLKDEETPGSVPQFLAGFALFCGGSFLVLQNTTIYSGFTLTNLIGITPPFGLVLLPFLIGVGVLCFSGKSVVGWLLTIFGFTTILLGILMGLRIIFRPVSLYQGLLMFVMIAAGVGLMVRQLRKR